MRRDPSATTERISESALEYFTDREMFRETFLRHLHVVQADEAQVLVFYGVGGVGKTTLVRKLGQELDGALAPFPAPRLPHARFDLENLESPVQGYREVLVRLRNELGKSFDLDFPRFDLCLALMLAQEGGAAPKLVEVNSTLSNVYQILLTLSPLPFTYTASAIGSFFVKEGTKRIPAFEYWMRRAGGTDALFDLRRRAHDDDQTLPDELIRRFAEDLKEGLPARPGYACRAALLLDSYERLWADREAYRSAQARRLDEWVRQLASYCLGSGILLVITGRDRLRWAEDDPGEWNGCLDQHLLGGLAADDAQAFLAKCGIGADFPATPTALQNAIIACCDAGDRSKDAANCHTLFLALCAEIVLHTRHATGADPGPEMFGSLPPGKVASELADRFLRSLHDRAKEIWLEELSLTPRFDKAAALTLWGGTSSTEADAAWEMLTGFSFATPQPDGFWRLHETMRNALRLRVTPDTAPRIHALLRDYWTAHNDPTLAFFHGWCLDPAGARGEWTLKHEAALKEGRIRDARRLLTWWADITLDEADRQALGEQEWGTTHVTLGLARAITPMAPRAASLHRVIAHYEAALRVYTEPNYPQEWAMIQNNLGKVYRNLPTGDRTQNLARAVACFEAALRIRTEADFPRDWATTQNNLGNAYRDLPTGDRAANLRKSIAHYEAALRIRTEQDLPEEWALTQNNLGNAYGDLPAGDPTQNMTRAIACYESALRVYTEQDFPQDWAMTQNNLGATYGILPTGDAGQNLTRAIACFEAALRVYTEPDFPLQWSVMLNNLGDAYQSLPTGDRMQNLTRAVAYCEAALRVRTEADFPRDWAMTQNNLGDAYRDLTTGDRAAHIKNSIACYESALRVYTERDFPQEWAMTQNNLGLIFLLLAQETYDVTAFLSAAKFFTAAERGYAGLGLPEAAAKAASQKAAVAAALKQIQDVRT